MNKLYAITLALVGAIHMGCRSENTSVGIIDNLPQSVGGIRTELIVFEKNDAPTVNIAFKEIILSNDQVVIEGTIAGLPGRRMVVNPWFFKFPLACTILSSVGLDRPFRLVADDEFRLVDPLPTDMLFEISKLVVEGEHESRFSYSYRGFPSDAEKWSIRKDMNMISKLNATNRVSYLTKSIVGVRFADQVYEYPNDDESEVNIQGEGECLLIIK